MISPVQDMIPTVYTVKETRRTHSKDHLKTALVLLEAPPIPVLNFHMEGRLHPSISIYPRTLSMRMVNFVNRAIDKRR